MNENLSQQASQRKDPRTLTMDELKALAGEKFVQTSWYRVTRDADKRIREISKGEFYLLSSRFKGDDHAHWIGDRCGHRFYASVAEIRREGLTANPYYQPFPPDVSRLGSDRGLAEYTQFVSSGQAKSVLEQPLRGLDDDYMFYCYLHDVYYAATLREFILSAKSTCACPACEEEN
jgi:hypothetical protein